MPKGFFDGSDPNAKPGEFVKCSPGGHEVCGIEWIKTDGQFPVYVSDNYRGLVARVRFIRTDEGTSPVGSFTPNELFLLVRAFGGDIKALPKDRNTGQFLTEVEKQIKNANGKTFVTVNDKGWVSKVDGANIPEGFYQFQVIEAKSMNNTEPLRFMPGTFNGKPTSPTIKVFYKVTGNSLGKPTIYDGMVIMGYVGEAWEGIEDGMPKWKLSPTGSNCMDAIRMQRFVEAYCPYFEHEWEENPTRSSYGINEIENPIVVVMDKVIKEGRSVPIQYKPNKNGNMFIDLSTIILENEEDIVTEEEETIEDMGDIYVVDSPIFNEHFNLCEFANYIYIKCPTAFVTVPVREAKELKLTEAGKQWANKNLDDIWVKAQLEGGKRPIAEIDEVSARKFMEVINSAPVSDWE